MSEIITESSNEKLEIMFARFKDEFACKELADEIIDFLVRQPAFTKRTESGKRLTIMVFRHAFQHNSSVKLNIDDIKNAECVIDSDRSAGLQRFLLEFILYLDSKSKLDADIERITHISPTCISKGEIYNLLQADNAVYDAFYYRVKSEGRRYFENNEIKCILFNIADITFDDDKLKKMLTDYLRNELIEISKSEKYGPGLSKIHEVRIACNDYFSSIKNAQELTAESVDEYYLKCRHENYTKKCHYYILADMMRYLTHSGYALTDKKWDIKKPVRAWNTTHMMSFIDKNMFKLIDDFLEQDKKFNEINSIRQTKIRCAFKIAFHNKILDSLTVDDICEADKTIWETTTRSDPASKYYFRFLLYAYDHGAINLDVIERLKHVEFEKFCPACVITEIITSDNFDNYMTGHDITWMDRKHVFDFCRRLSPEGYNDQRLFDLLNNYFENIVKCRKHAQYDLPNISMYSNQFFANVNEPGDITAERISDYIETFREHDEVNIKHRDDVTIRNFINIIYYLLESSYITDANLQALLPLKDAMANWQWNIDGLQEFLAYPIANNVVIKYSTTKYGVKKDKWKMIYIGTSVPDIFELLKKLEESCLDQRHDQTFILRHFDESFGDFHVSSIHDLSWHTFIQQTNYFAKKGTKCFAILSAFYRVATEKYNKHIFDDSPLSESAMLRNDLMNRLADGYYVVKYDPMDEVPSQDKLIIAYDGSISVNRSIRHSNSVCVDFTVIHEGVWRQFAKEYIWYESFKGHINLADNVGKIQLIAVFVNCLYKNSSKDEITKINGIDILYFQQAIEDKKISDKNAKDKIRTIAAFINYLRLNRKIIVTVDAIEMLKNTSVRDDTISTPHALSKEEIKKLADYLEKKSHDGQRYELFNIIFWLALVTEMRISEILTLTDDCVLQTAKQNEFLLQRKAKTTHGEIVPIPISLDTKNQIDTAIKISDEVRSKCELEDKKHYIFIIESIHSLRGNEYHIISVGVFNKFLKKCCRDIGIPAYTAENLRDTHMTLSEEYIFRRKISTAYKKVLTGHADANSDLYYIDRDALLVQLETANRMSIGNVNLPGKVIEETPENMDKADIVNDGCGYCDCKQCTNYTFVKCLMCKDFIATYDRIPFFQHMVKHYDNMIAKSEIKHDKESFAALKKLCLGYIYALEKQHEEHKEAVSHAD